MGFNLYDTWASYHKKEKKPVAASRASGGSERPDTRKSEKRRDYRLIVSRDVFKTKAMPSRGKGESAKKSKLEELKENTRFELMGTVVGEDGHSYAIIREKNKKDQDIYALDDYVEDAKIARILTDRVIVERAGTEEVLVISHERGPARRSAISTQRKIEPPPKTRTPVRRRPVRSKKLPVIRSQVKPEAPNEPD